MWLCKTRWTGLCLCRWIHKHIKESVKLCMFTDYCDGRGSPGSGNQDEMLTSIVAFTCGDGGGAKKRGTRKIKRALDGREIAPHSRCRNRFTSANEHLEPSGDLWKNLLISLSVNPGQSAILLSVIAPALLLSLRPRWLMCLSMYTSHRRLE